MEDNVFNQEFKEPIGEKLTSWGQKMLDNYSKFKEVFRIIRNIGY